MRRLVLLLEIFAALAAAEQAPVILISIDTLRADHLSAYGYRRIRTPHIDSFAQQGTLFTNIEAQIPLTLPSHTSLFTSTYPFENQIEENAERVPAGAVTLASVLRSQGYKTAAFIGSVFLESEMGLDQGFEVYDSPFHFEAFSPISGSMFFGGMGRNPLSVRDRRDGALVLGAARRWLAANRGEPAFVFVHLFDLHKPISAPGYDAELAYTDQILGAFQQALIESGWWQRSLVVLLSDHGESLGDHGEDSHGYFIYESTLHVPLMIHWPSGAPDHAPRDSRPGGLMDVAPSILDFCTFPRRPRSKAAACSRPTARTRSTAKASMRTMALDGRRCAACAWARTNISRRPGPSSTIWQPTRASRQSVCKDSATRAGAARRSYASCSPAAPPSSRPLPPTSRRARARCWLRSDISRAARGGQLRCGPEGPSGRIPSLRKRADRALQPAPGRGRRHLASASGARPA
jgi:hypothetical protein